MTLFLQSGIKVSFNYNLILTLFHCLESLSVAIALNGAYSAMTDIHVGPWGTSKAAKLLYFNNY